MAYLKPPAFTKKVFNPIAAKLGLSGSAELVVVGRRSGTPRSVPVIPVEVDGVLYVVSTRGEAEWVRNLRAAETCQLRGRHHPGQYAAEELSTENRAPVLAAYRAKAGGMVKGYFSKLPDSGDHPVFRLSAR
ncbi:MAG TPA: nitroreductase family deazaflavin-dependent oxidoreductase [Actinomycetales bacterium]|nr:nitroreductase family deazaflavin-dependent oxidoreductase [Actinomycetales bacterium]